MYLRHHIFRVFAPLPPNLLTFSFKGCVITGNLSDVIGRKPVVVGCLLGTVISHIMVARSTTLAGVAWGRVIGGVTGGLTPIAQAAVADVVRQMGVQKVSRLLVYVRTASMMIFV